MRRKSKIDVGIWLVFHGEMPPFRRERLESMAEHRLAQNHAVLELGLVDFPVLGRLVTLIFPRVLHRFGIAAPIRMALDAEMVEGAAHVRFLACFHIEKRQINGGTAAVTGLGVDIAVRE